MSRSTQWIGLTTSGTLFTRGLERLPSDKHTNGMFDEELPLGKWKAPEGRWHRAKFVREVVQEVPWSSGPMIFTRLEIEFHQEGGQMFTAPCFEWIHDPEEKDEFSYENGTLWV